MTHTDRNAGAPNPSAKPKRGGIPPLTWIVVGLLALLAVIAFATMDGRTDGPSDGVNMPVDLPEAPAAVDPAPLPTPSPNPGPPN